MATAKRRNILWRLIAGKTWNIGLYPLNLSRLKKVASSTAAFSQIKLVRRRRTSAARNDKKIADRVHSKSQQLPPDYSNAKADQEIGGGKSSQPLSCPFGITISPNTGNILLTDSDNHQIKIFDHSLRHLRSIGSEGTNTGEFRYPQGIDMSSQGLVFVADRGNHRIQVLDEDGMFQYTIGCEGDTPGNFRQPWDLAVDIEDKVYVCDWGNERVQVLNSDGSYIKTLSKVGGNTGDLESKPCFVSTHLDQVIISDLSGFLYIYDLTGRLIKTLNITNGVDGRDPASATFDHWGNLLVADLKQGCITILDRIGTRSRLGTPGSGYGKLDSPCGVTTTAEGDVLVCDCQSSKVVRYSVPKRVLVDSLVFREEDHVVFYICLYIALVLIVVTTFLYG